MLFFNILYFEIVYYYYFLFHLLKNSKLQLKLHKLEKLAFTSN
jgi:hypothetical protein